MLSHWLPSWYTTQPQSQEPFNDQYEATEEEWVQVLTATTEQQSLETNEPSPPTINDPLQDKSIQVAETKQDKSVMKSDTENEKPLITKLKEEKVTKQQDKENSVPKKEVAAKPVVTKPEEEKVTKQQESAVRKTEVAAKPEEGEEPKIVKKPLSRQERRARERMAKREKLKKKREESVWLKFVKDIPVIVE